MSKRIVCYATLVLLVAISAGAQPPKEAEVPNGANVETKIKTAIAVLERDIEQAEANLKKLLIQQARILKAERRFKEYWKQQVRRMAGQQRLEALRLMASHANAAALRNRAGVGQAGIVTFDAYGVVSATAVTWYDPGMAAIDRMIADDISRDANAQYSSWQRSVGTNVAAAKARFEAYQILKKDLVRRINPLIVNIRNAKRALRRLKRDLADLNRQKRADK